MRSRCAASSIKSVAGFAFWDRLARFMLAKGKHPTTNIQHPTPNSRQAARAGHWVLDVGCWMLDVRCSLPVKPVDLPERALVERIRQREQSRSNEIEEKPD